MYLLIPLVSWFVSGCLKFIINYLRYGLNAKDRVGNGGFPSTHTTIITSATMLVGLNEGFNSSIFGLGSAITFIVIIDAMGIRRALGNQASIVNILAEKTITPFKKLRESQGHTRFEVLGGIVLGTLLAFLYKLTLSQLGL